MNRWGLVLVAWTLLVLFSVDPSRPGNGLFGLGLWLVGLMAVALVRVTVRR